MAEFGKKKPEEDDTTERRVSPLVSVAKKSAIKPILEVDVDAMPRRSASSEKSLSEAMGMGDDKGEDIGLASAANAVFTALKTDDRASFAAALRSYVRQCEAKEALNGSTDETDNYGED